jgi:hypothetical protein
MNGDVNTDLCAGGRRASKRKGKSNCYNGLH